MAIAAVGCVSTAKVTGHADPRAGLAGTAPAPTSTSKKAAGPREVLRLDDADPLVAFRLVFETGSADDPAGKEGLTALTADLMREATVKADASTLSDMLFPMAAQFSVQTDKDTTAFLGRVHRDHAEAFARLLVDVVTAPRLSAEDFARKLDEQQAFLKSTLRTGNDELLQREALEAVLYDQAVVFGEPLPAGTTRHPYAHTPAGTAAGLENVTLDDVKAHLRRVFTADRLVVGVAGGANDDVMKVLRQGLTRLPATSPARATPTTPTLNGHHLLIVEKPSAGTAISLGFTLPTLDRSHPDYTAMKLAETYFGEHRNLIGHLFHSMREVRGLNYGDYAYVEHFVQAPGTTFESLNISRRTQYFSMWIRPVEHKNRQFALQMALWELQNFAAKGIPDDDTFKRVQGFVQGYWPSKQQDAMRDLGYAVDDVLTTPALNRAEMLKGVQTLSRADVNAAIARHLQAVNLSMVVVTENAAPLVEALATKKPAVIAYDAEQPKAVLQEDKAIATTHPHLDAGRIKVVTPDAVFAR